MPKLSSAATSIQFLAVILLLVIATKPMATQTAQYSVTISNDSSLVIQHIRISSPYDDAWEADELGDNVLRSGYSLKFQVPAGRWEVDIRDNYGNSCVIHNVLVSGNMRLSLTDDTLSSACVLAGGGGGGNVASPTLPQFPWPPPTASASEVVPGPLLQQHRQFKQLKDLNALLIAALEKNGYVEKSYYAVPKGFAVVTRLEQIGTDGVSKPPPGRWSPDLPKLEQFTVGEYVRALFAAKAGYYRTIVFVVTTVPFAQRDAKLSEDEAQKWLSGGLNVLPEAIGSQQYISSVVCTALIYEFEREQDKAAELRLPSRLDSRTHLVKSGIWQALQEGQ